MHSLPKAAVTSGEDKTDKLVYSVRKGEKDGDGGVNLLVHPQTGRERGGKDILTVLYIQHIAPF